MTAATQLWFYCALEWISCQMYTSQVTAKFPSTAATWPPLALSLWEYRSAAQTALESQAQSVEPSLGPFEQGILDPELLTHGLHQGGENRGSMQAHLFGPRDFWFVDRVHISTRARVGFSKTNPRPRPRAILAQV